MHKKNLKIILPFLFFIVFFVFLSFDRSDTFIEEKFVEKKQIQNIENKTDAQFYMSMGEESIVLNFNLGLSLYDVFLQAKEMGDLAFEGKRYPGLGFFVNSIGSLNGGDGKNLIYYINEEEAKVGISSYVPKDGDIISWQLE